jgi:hypothetical protein
MADELSPRREYVTATEPKPGDHRAPSACPKGAKDSNVTGQQPNQPDQPNSHDLAMGFHDNR